MRLEIGERAKVCAAWPRFPELAFDVLEQEYERTSAHGYRYQRGTVGYDLTVNADELVIEYPNLRRAEAIMSRD